MIFNPEALVIDTVMSANVRLHHTKGRLQPQGRAKDTTQDQALRDYNVFIMSLNILYETHMKVIEQEHKISQQVGGRPATLSHKTDEK